MVKHLLSCMAVLCAALLLSACELVSEESPAPATGADPAEEVAAPTPAITVTVTRNANVRAGPGTEHDIHFWLTADTPVHVSGRNADGDWLRIEHEGAGRLALRCADGHRCRSTGRPAGRVGFAGTRR